MQTMHISPILTEIFGLTMIALALKALLLGTCTAATRGRLKSFLNAEDAAWLGGAHVNPDPEAVARFGRAHRNDLENLLPFFIAGVFYVIAGGPVWAGAIYCGAFAIGRVLHTFAYLHARPALRRNGYTIGFLAIVAISLHAAWLLTRSLS